MTSDRPILIRAIRGPLLLITLGLLFLFDLLGSQPFYKTWPVLLIVFGALKLLERTAIRDNSTRQTPAGGAA
jgi:hypothetical protein